MEADFHKAGINENRIIRLFIISEFIFVFKKMEEIMNTNIFCV